MKKKEHDITKLVKKNILVEAFSHYVRRGGKKEKRSYLVEYRVIKLSKSGKYVQVKHMASDRMVPHNPQWFEIGEFGVGRRFKILEVL